MTSWEDELMSGHFSQVVTRIFPFQGDKNATLRLKVTYRHFHEDWKVLLYYQPYSMVKNFPEEMIWERYGMSVSEVEKLYGRFQRDSLEELNSMCDQTIGPFVIKAML